MLDSPVSFCYKYVHTYKGCEEKEYAPERWHREQEKVKTCTYASAEWFSELQGKRINPSSLCRNRHRYQGKAYYPHEGTYAERVRLAFPPSFHRRDFLLNGRSA
jgi:hypothetical protein